MRRSTTLAGLATATDQVIFNLAGRANGCCNMWAPEFHLLNGPNGNRWYLYYTAGRNVPDYNPTQRLHVLESAGTDPMDPTHWTKKSTPVFQPHPPGSDPPLIHQPK